MLTIRASALGSCTKALIADLLGYAPLPVSDKMQGIYDRGNTHEADCVNALEADGYHIWCQNTMDDPGHERFVWDQDQVYIEIESGSVKITGHLDGVIAPLTTDWVAGTRERILECKSPASWAKFEQAARTNIWTDPLCHRYGWQISAYMLALDMEAMVTCLDGEEVKSFVIEVPPFSLEDIEARCIDIAEAVALNQLPVGCSQADWPCPVAYLHEEPEFEEDDTLDSLVISYAFWTEEEKLAKRSKDEAKERIEAHLGERESVNTQASKVSRYTQKNPDKVDKDALRRDGLYETYVTPGGESTRIKITARDDA
jgi:hypothetical protein